LVYVVVWLSITASYTKHLFGVVTVGLEVEYVMVSGRCMAS
jgi:hypothetical protein